MRPLVLLAIVAATCLPERSFAQVPAAERTRQEDFKIDAAMRRATIDSLSANLVRYYVFPDVAKDMVSAIQARQRRHEYDRITSAAEFADSLNHHLHAVHNDLHLRVSHSIAVLPANTREQGAKTDDQLAADRRFAQWANQGFAKVERLAGNVGYVDILLFFEGDAAYETASAAMNFLANADALIIDLRRCGGGSPDMVAYVTSYLFGMEPVHLNDLCWREGNRTQEFWTRAEVPGKRSAAKDVYVLTSSNTASGAEEFAYNLKNLKRATVVGERTAGGANPGEFFRLGDHFGAFIANGRAVNPITKTNWEGTGVEPDVKASGDEALRIARTMALTHLLAKNTDPEERRKIQRALDELKPASASPGAGG